AAGSMLTVMLQGLNLDQALKVKNKDVAAALGGLPAAKVHCSVLAEGALKKAVADYRKRTSA
ncbi:MAG: iron-sulfur cluster assembly scaffold protein, partial [Chloroflexi bacterium]|nr:iron-sulfur cluster assembly scaffold protein [Chloroflexota bacterium]